jgi:Ca2+/Na+ antiporter
MSVFMPGSALSSEQHPSTQFLSPPKRSANRIHHQVFTLSPPDEVVLAQDAWQQKQDRSPNPTALQTSAANKSPYSSPRESSDGSEPTFQATRSSIGGSTDRDSRSSLDTDCSESRFNEDYARHDIELGPLLPSTELEVGYDLRELQTPLPIAIIVLILATCVVSISTELAVDAIPAMVDSWHISHVFLGFIVLPVVGNAAEHVTAAKLAMKNKMVLAKNVAVESSTQVVLLIAPAIVLIGWARNRSMTLHFDPFEIGCVISAAIVLGAVICYGSTGWKQGTMLWSIYGAFAVASLFYRGR